MVRPNRRTTWLPLAIAAAIAVTNPFLVVGAGGALGLLVLCCDNRQNWRRIAGASLVPLAAFGMWYDPLLALFAATSALVAVYSLKGNLFSSVTSSALIGCAAGAMLTALVVAGGAGESWSNLENSVLESQQTLQQMASDGAAGDVEQEIAWQEMNRLVVRLIPGQFALMMVAGLFLAVILFRRFGSSRFHLSLGISTSAQSARRTKRHHPDSLWSGRCLLCCRDRSRRGVSYSLTTQTLTSACTSAWSLTGTV